MDRLARVKNKFDDAETSPHLDGLRRLRSSCIRAARAAWRIMQAEELSYAIVTPYSMRKSRTGGIVSRLISRTGLDLVSGRMFAPSPDLVRRYAETIVTETEPRYRATQELIRAYVLKNFARTTTGQRPRGLFL